jgi:hypothetical protein
VIINRKIYIVAVLILFTSKMRNLYKSPDIGSIIENDNSYRNSTPERGRLSTPLALLYGAIAAIAFYSGGCCTEYKPKQVAPVSQTTQETAEASPRVTRRVVVPEGNAKDGIAERLDIAMKYSDPNDIKKAIENLKTSDQ